MKESVSTLPLFVPVQRATFAGHFSFFARRRGSKNESSKEQNHSSEISRDYLTQSNAGPKQH